MRKTFKNVRFFSALLCAVMLISVLASPVLAAKQKVSKACGYIGIRGCAIPVAGEKPDCNVEENWPSQYTIMSVNWYCGSVSAASAVGATETFRGDTVYIVEFEVWAKDGYYFTTDSNGYTTVEADVSPNYAEYGEFDAQVFNVYGEDNTKCLTVRYTFPKTEATKISNVTITDVVAPRAGETPYYYGTLNHSIMKLSNVRWYHGSQEMGTKEKFIEGDTYTVHFDLAAAPGYEFATDTTSLPAPTGHRWPKVTATVNGESAAVMFNTKYDSTEKHITVATSFVCGPTRLISNVEITGVTEPVAGADPSRYVKLGSDKYKRTDLSTYYYSGGVGWLDGKGNLMKMNQDKFGFSTAYTIEINLEPTGEYKFATNEYGVSLVSATVNGNKADTSLNNGVLTVTYKFKRTAGLEVSKVEVNDLDAPVVGASPDYDITYGSTTYGAQSVTGDEYIKNGVQWHCDTTGKYMKPGDKFQNGYTYTVFVMISTVGDYEFKYVSSSDSYTVNGKINGKSAELEECNDTDATIRYTFTVKANEINKVDVKDIDAPKAGELADYTATLGDTTYVPMYTKDDNETKNSIMWYDETAGDYLRPDVDRFIGGHKYSVIVILKPVSGYTFKYIPESDSYTADAKINGKAANIEECFDDSITIYYDFTCEKIEHKCSPLKVNEVKATCAMEGRKAYYFCPECGTNYEDSKCTKAIVDINAWGVIPKLDHSGGKATCVNRAICKNCGEEYGELAAHNFGTAWEYTDATGHAHKCKVCGIHDTVVAHSGGTAKCGEAAKCAECKAEYGEVKQHQWSTGYSYTDKNGHARKCTVCGEKDTVVAHTGGTADCKNKAKCSECGVEYGKLGDHKWSSSWSYSDKKGHAHKCTVCGEHDDIVKHTPGAAATQNTAQTCTACNYVIVPEKGHTHKMVKTDAVDATCTTAGKKQYYYCSDCGLISSDSKGSKEIEDEDSLIIPATGHKDSKWKSDADVHWKECSVKGCGIITEEKEAHELNKSGKCTVCGYKAGGKTDSEDTSDVEIGVNTDLPDVTDETDPTAPGSEQTPDSSEGTGSKTDGDGNMTMLIIIIAAGVVAIVLVITVVTVVVKKSKKS